eukprot:3397938-Amphidinium_carterae.1
MPMQVGENCLNFARSVMGPGSRSSQSAPYHPNLTMRCLLACEDASLLFATEQSSLECVPQKSTSRLSATPILRTVTTEVQWQPSFSKPSAGA